MRSAEGLKAAGSEAPRLRRVQTTLFLALVLVAARAGGQAWTPPAGAGSIILSSQTLHADAHTQGTGKLDHNIDLRAYSISLSADYGLTDRLALSAALPYVSSRYRGPIPHAGSIVDDGEFHGSVSDLDLELRYNVSDGAVVATPFIGGQWPTRNYETLGHAAAGRGLTEYSAGIDLGHDASRIVSGLFVAGSYQYSFVEKVHEDILVNRSNFDLRFVWYATQRVGLHAGSLWQRTHGGLSIPLAPEERARHAHHHDQMLRADHWRATAGISYSLRPNVDLFVSWGTAIRSENSHQFRTLAVGTGWNFAAAPLIQRLRRSAALHAAAVAEGR